MSERRGRLPESFAEQAIEAVDAFGITFDTAPSNAAVLSLARRHRLSVYDTLYLEVALRCVGQLTTLDIALARAAKAEGVDVF